MVIRDLHPTILVVLARYGFAHTIKSLRKKSQLLNNPTEIPTTEQSLLLILFAVPYTLLTQRVGLL